MNDQFDFSAEPVAFDEGDDVPVVAWSLDELDSDLDSVRSAWGHTDS